MRLLHVLGHEVRLMLVALQFLTRIPAPARLGYEPAWLTASVRHFPLAGAIVGAAGAGVLCAAQMFWPPWVAAVLAVATTLWLTAAFHEDGLADTFDALLGAAPREKAMAIMKDSRIGTYGSAALVIVLVLRIALAAELLTRGNALAATALLASHVIARAGAVALMAMLPYAASEDDAKAKPLARGVKPRDALWACAWCLGLLATPWPVARIVTAFAATGALVLVLRPWLRRRLGGYTGDTLGAAEQLGEAVVLLALAAA